MTYTLLNTLLLAVPLVSASKWSSEADILQFDNVGYTGFYYPVSKIEALDNGNCSCAKDYDNPIKFDGPLSPFDEGLTVHFRGPMNLLKFAYYVTDSYNFDQSDGEWKRNAYYDAVSGSAENVTFLANYGHENVCLGRAADYVSSDGLTKADTPQILENTTIPSAREFAIASGLECSGFEDCGAYRTDGQAYHGFGGVNKMFLFEFNSPADLSQEDKVNKTYVYDMPAIWLLNDRILRTSQYPLNGDCSSWNSGAGEFDIFEVMNVTERNHFYSTIHDFQGTDDIGTGLQNFGWLERTPNATMRGGVIFSQDKSITVFLSNDTSIDETIKNSDLKNWVAPLLKGKEEVETLSSISVQPPSSTATNSKASTVSSIKSSSHKNDSGVTYVSSFLSVVSILLGFFI